MIGAMPDLKRVLEHDVQAARKVQIVHSELGGCNPHHPDIYWRLVSIVVKKDHHDQLCTSKSIKPLALL